MQQYVKPLTLLLVMGLAGSCASDAGSAGAEDLDGLAEETYVTVTGHVNGGPARSAAFTERICIFEREDLNCADTSDALYSIAAPADSEVALLITGEGLTPTLRVFITTDADLELGNTRVANAAGLSQVADAIGVEHDPDKGAVFFGGVQGVMAELEPSSGEVFYLDMAGNLLSEASSIQLRGTGGFLNVDPGLTTLRFAHPDHDCTFNSVNTFSGWPDQDDEGVAVVPVLAGHHTSIISMFCGEPVSSL